MPRDRSTPDVPAMRDLPDLADVPDVAELAARLRLATARLARQLRQQAGTGLSPSQHAALASIELHEPLTLGRLARIEQVAPPTVTRVVSRLEDDGLVTRTVDETDRRVSRVSTTAAGRRRLEHSRKRRNAWLARRLRAEEDSELRHLAAVLPLLEKLAAAPGEAAIGERGDPGEPEGVDAAGVRVTGEPLTAAVTGEPVADREGMRGATAAPESAS
jgi:DNA-binding MarR family transcriptional regulator